MMENATTDENEVLSATTDENEVLSANGNEAENGISRENNEFVHKRSLTVCKTSCFILGEVAGSGILVLPKVLSETGWYGLFLLAFCCGVTLYSSILLGRCWTILEEKCEECRAPSRFPYPMIAHKAFGRKMRIFTSMVIDGGVFGVFTVFLVLSSELLSNGTHRYISLCSWIFIFAGCLYPILWLGTPKDFWFAGILATSSTSLASIILFVLLSSEISSSHMADYYPGPTFSSFFTAYASLMYCFTGGAAFPTFQNDMKDRKKFPVAATIAFTILFLIYLSVATMGYCVYGNTIQSKLTESLPESKPRTTAEILFACNMFFASPIILNPALQDVGACVGVPRNFGWKRVFFRTGVLMFAVLIAESLPNFRKVLNLVGSTTGGLTGMIFPCLFYYKLSSKWDLWKERKYQVLEKIIICLIILSATVGTVISTYQSIADVVTQNYCPSCFQKFSGKCIT